MPREHDGLAQTTCPLDIAVLVFWYGIDVGSTEPRARGSCGPLRQVGKLTLQGRADSPTIPPAEVGGDRTHLLQKLGGSKLHADYATRNGRASCGPSPGLEPGGPYRAYQSALSRFYHGHPSIYGDRGHRKRGRYRGMATRVTRASRSQGRVRAPAGDHRERLGLRPGSKTGSTPDELAGRNPQPAVRISPGNGR